MTVKLVGSSSGSVALAAPASTTSSANIEFKLPVADGSANQLLKTDGSGQLSFASILAASSSDLTINSGSSDNPLLLNSTNANGAHLRFQSSGTTKHYIGCAAGFGFGDHEDLALRTTDNLIFATGSTERLRINSAGDIMSGSTTVEVGRGNTTIGVTLRPEGRVYYNSNDSFSSFGRNSDGVVLVFTRSGTDVGNISVTSSATSYNTGSDYRLKENVTAISDGITRLKTLKPSRFNFKVDTDTPVDGFLAHEVTAVPEAITGTKDEVDSDNKPVYQGIDQSKLVPLLTAALQEAVAKIETLETKVAALEAK